MEFLQVLQIATYVLGILGAIVSVVKWVIYYVTNKLGTLEKQMSELANTVSTDYVRKDDFKDFITDFKKTIDDRLTRYETANSSLVGRLDNIIVTLGKR